MKPKYLILLILFNVIWAGSFTAYKALGAFLQPGGIVTLRFGLAALVLAAVWRWLPGPAPRGWELGATGLLGLVVFCLGHRLQVIGNSMGLAGNSAVLMAIEPLLTSIAAAVFLREQIPARRWLGFGLGMAGAALLNGILRPDFRFANLTASLLLLASFLSESAYSIMGKPLAIRASPLKVLTLSLVAGTLLNLAIDGPATLAEVPRLPAAAWLTLAYLSLLCTVAGYAFWLIVIRESDVSGVVLTIFVQPVAGVPIAMICLNESLYWEQLWGSLAILAGLAAGLLGNGRSRAATPAPATNVSGA
jgi:drug/metabolite transporter (DMT)-like permease